MVPSAREVVQPRTTIATCDVPQLIEVNVEGIGVPVWITRSGWCNPFSTGNAFAPVNMEHMVYQTSVDLNAAHPGGSLGSFGNYRVRIRLWGLVEVRKVGTQSVPWPDGASILDYGQMYLAPSLEDYVSLPLLYGGNPTKDACGNDLDDPEQKFAVFGSFSRDPRAMRLYYPNEWHHWVPAGGNMTSCGWKFDEFYWATDEGQSCYGHGHPHWAQSYRAVDEEAYQQGNRLHGGCARPQSFVPMVPVKMDPRLANATQQELERLQRAFWPVDRNINIYTVGIYDKNTGECEELWAVNLWGDPVSNGHPALRIPNYAQITNIALNGVNRGALRIHVVDWTHEFIVPGGQKKLVLRIDSCDFGSGVLLPAYVSQIFAHASRWQRLRRLPEWQNNPFVKYMNDMGFPHDWLWPRATNPPESTDYKNINWYFETVQSIARTTAQQAALSVPVSSWPRCVPIGSNTLTLPEYGPDRFVPFMQTMVIVDRTITPV